MRNTSNNSGDGTLTMVPLCRGLSGTRITLGKWWKSRGQVGSTMDVTCYDKDLHDRFLFISVYWYGSHSNSCLILLPASSPIISLTHAQLAVVTQSCALLYITAHCDLLLQWRYCSSDAYCSRYSIVLLQYISQACWVPCSPRLDFFHRTVISTLVAANRLKIPSPSCLIHLKSYSLQRP